jgi:hypothetical protein
VNDPIIDADGHVLEKDRELRDYLGGRTGTLFVNLVSALSKGIQGDLRMADYSRVNVIRCKKLTEVHHAFER